MSTDNKSLLPDITIIIATFNSMHVLPKVLEAIGNQSYPQNKITVMLVDGGSSDETVKYGTEKNCIVKKNPRTEPVYAKFIGFSEAETELIIYLDHDEVYENQYCLEHQVKLLIDNDLKVVLSTGYVNPPSEHLINDYINEYGDPFSLFVYRISKAPDVFIKDLQKKYVVKNDSEIGCVIDFGEKNSLPLIELLAMGTLLNKAFFQKEFPGIVAKAENLPHLFYIMLQLDTNVGVCKTHKLLHFSSESVLNYIRKIKWRINNNIYHTDSVGASGFLKREELMGLRSGIMGKIKKILFLPYVFLIFPVLIDTIYLFLKRRNRAFLYHFPLCFYTATTIVWNIALKKLGKSPVLKSYDGKKEIHHD
ncbi:glycosyltransferase family 2 protein [Marinomonas epiphytica]